MDHRYEKLIVLVEEGSYSAAAKKLHISQPAVTIAIASLEMGLNQKLFSQKKPTVILSDAGHIVYKTAKKISKEIGLMNRSLAAGSIATSTISVGLIDSIAYLLYSNAKNNIILNDVEAMVDNSKKIITDVIENNIELGVITGQNNLISSTLKVKKLTDEPFVFVKKASLVNDSPVNNIDDWLAFNRASTSYHHFTKLFKNIDLSVKPIFYSTSLELLKNMAINGTGTALLPKHFVAKELQDSSLARLNTPDLYRPIWSVTKKNYSSPIGPTLENSINSLLGA